MRNFVALLCIVVFLGLNSVEAQENYYVLLTGGQLHVFPLAHLSQCSHDDASITMVALDGSCYTYSMSRVASFSQQEPRTLPSMESFKIDNKYNYQVVTDAYGVIDGSLVNVEVAGIGKHLTSSFSLSDSDAVAWVDGRVQHSTVSRQRFQDDVTYTVGYPGDKVLVDNGDGSYSMEQYGRDYRVHVHFLTDDATTVPRIDINTVDGRMISSKDYYVDAEIIIDGAGVFPSMRDSVQVKGHGNSSWSTDSMSKNPYRLKFSTKQKPLGLTKGKNWVLLANKMRGSMLTNAIGMKAASLMGTSNVNHMIPVELYINGEYRGSYNLTEKVGMHNNSIDLDDETRAVLLDLDRYFDDPESQKYASPLFYLPVVVKYPDFGSDETLVTLDMVKQRFNELEHCVYHRGDIDRYFDMDALARYKVLNEYIFNRELLWPKSAYLYNVNLLEDTSKFIFGPVWDLDYAFNPDNLISYFYADVNDDYYQSVVNKSGWRFFSALNENRQLGRRSYKIFKEFVEQGLDELCEFCRDYYSYAAPSIAHNSQLWTSHYYNYGNQANLASQWLRNRANAFCQMLAVAYAVPGDIDGDGALTINDVTVIIDYLLDRDGAGLDLDAADVDDDGAVNIHDVTTLISLLLGSR